MNINDVKAEIEYILTKEGKNKGWLAEQLGMKDQSNLSKVFSNKSITLDKIDELLKPLGYKVTGLKIDKVKEDK